MPRPVQSVTGSELVLSAQVPKAGGRWHQVHFNQAVTEQFFRLAPGTERRVSLERVDHEGCVHEPASRPLVLSEINKNSKVEFDFGGVAEYPADGVPLLLVLELDLRAFRYVALCPGDTGYDEMLEHNRGLKKLGRGKQRGITNLDEIELRWPACPLRDPRPV